MDTNSLPRSGINIANVSWGDHLEWGAGSARLGTPDDFARSVERWVARDGAGRIHFREQEYYRRHGRHVRQRPRDEIFVERPGFDENAEIIRRGHEAGLAVYLYVTIFDELWLDTQWAWPWDPTTNWLSDYVRDHPEDVLVDRAGRERLWGVLDYNAAAAREYRVGVIRELLDEHEWDGLFVCTRSQSRPAADGDQFGFNEPSLALYRERTGRDALADSLNLDAWRAVRGEGLTTLVRELRDLTRDRGVAMSVGIPRGDVMGPPIGNLALDWRTWASDGLMDALVIGQISEICPSAWVHLWPESPVAGHLVDPVRFVGLRPLEHDLDEAFGPVLDEAGVELYLSRLHDNPDPAIEAALIAEHPLLSGIQYSTFRRDLGGDVASLPWKRTLQWPDGRNAWDPDRGLIRLELPAEEAARRA